MAVPRERLLLVRQVHGVHAQIVRQGEPIPAVRQTADIIVTDEPSAEMIREHRVDPAATPGSGRIVDPRRYATVEACGAVKDATH